MKLLIKIKNNRYFKLLSNIYFITFTIFLFWILFFDSNSILVNLKLQKEINQLKERKAELEDQISIDKKIISSLQNIDSLERYAREKLYMKKENEEIYIIEYTEE
ncbi:MAG: septum formation initiator family protein [Flavobacteriaceae bacterium]|jgi:cell division protein FtsB|nr:septum formation initiator family protein [Flavobacteriaceae bacterium]MBL6683871.1 septum formation initiator family protein [Flavobacteriaceae bacterium]